MRKAGDKSYQRLKKKLDEIYSVPINTLNFSPLNYLFKFFTSFLKSFPFKAIAPASIIAAILFYLVFGVLVVRLVSLLQYGF